MTKLTLALSALLLSASLVSAQERNLASAVDNPNGGPPRGIPVDMIEDGSFETATPNAFWTEASTNFGTPLCDIASCGTGAGTAGPQTGDWWAWFGGIAAPEIATVSQDVQISANSTATLDFSYWLGLCGADGDSLEVTVDGNQEWIDTCLAGVPGAGYAPVTLDLSAYADGGVHTILFNGTSSGAGTTNYNVDDISLTVVANANTTEVPTLGTWALMLLGLMLAGGAVYTLRS